MHAGRARRQASARPPPGEGSLPLALPILSTVVLLLSSVTLQRGIRQLRRDEAHKFLRSLIDTLALGAVFIVLQWLLWTSLYDQGLRTSSGLLGGVFYLLTIVHALHVLVGLGILVSLFPKAWRRHYGMHHHGGVRRAAMFWHFVDAVWIAIFFAIFVI